MNTPRFSVASLLTSLFGALAGCTAAVAQTPRPPMAPGSFISPGGTQEISMAPPFEDIVPSNEVRLRNIGNADLTLFYWNAEDHGVWIKLIVQSTAIRNITCQKCVSNVTISFNNGKETKQIPIPLGSDYTLEWSGQLNAWNLTPTPPRENPIGGVQ